MKYWISIDDYCQENYRIAKLLSVYDLQATFFIEARKNGNQKEPERQIKALAEFGFAIGCHSIDHVVLREVDELTQDLNIYYAKDLIESYTGKECKWYCPPKGKYNDFVLNKIKDAGFKYIRSTNVLDDKEIIEGLNNTTIHLYPRKQYPKYPSLDYFIHETLSLVNTTDGCFKFWCHGWEVEKLGLWNELENVFKYLKEYAHESPNL